MKAVTRLFEVLFAAVLALASIALHSKSKQGATKSLSWRKLRYVFVALSVLGTMAVTSQPLAAHADTTPTSDITDVLCGSEAQFPFAINPQTNKPDPNSNQWTYVPANSPVNDPDGPSTAVGYAGPHHDINNPDGVNCLGDYHYGWDQYYHQATWTWSINASSSLKECHVSAWIPTWYAGARDAQYSIAIQPSISPAPQGVTLSQDLRTGGQWVLLDFSGTGDGHIALGGGSSYAFTVTLQNGGGMWRYLGADAMKFECNYSGTPPHRQPIQTPPPHRQPIQTPPSHQQPIQTPPSHQQPIQTPPPHQQPL